ncbi:hypothetical protein [Trinickia acidisoli]|uniref:hypothetical protein n=1 Tax=Trinickia acidisoli TaxID=2767482 RepID=UPI001A8CCDD3|nr:hypothetical protein [Trinickia acidisoli]
MLSPHELAQLFVIVHAPETADIESPDLEALVERDLVQWVARSGDRTEFRVTPHGADVLARLMRTGSGSCATTKHA